MRFLRDIWTSAKTLTLSLFTGRQRATSRFRAAWRLINGMKDGGRQALGERV